MDGSSPYFLYEMQGPNVVGQIGSGNFGPLGPGECESISIPGGYDKVRIVAYQRPGHAGPFYDKDCNPVHDAMPKADCEFDNGG